MQGKSHAQYHVQKSLLLEKKARILEADAVGHQQHWDSLPPEKKARILEANAVGHQRYWEPFPLKKKARILETNAVGHQRYWESLPPKKKARILEADAVGHQQYWESLPPKKKARILEADAVGHQGYRKSLNEEEKIAARIKYYAATLHNMIDVDQATVEFLWDHFYKDPTLALAYYHCCSTDPRATIFNDKLGTNTDTSAMWDRMSKLIGDPIGQKETILCQQTFTDLDQSHAKIAACASCCKHLLSSDGKEGLVEMSIDDLPSAFLLTDDQKQRLTSLPHDIVINHVQVLQYKERFYHLNTDLVFNLKKHVLCPICARDPMAKDQESIAVGNDYGRLGRLKPLNGATQNACIPI